jgi:hypothetical protein
VNFIRSWDSCKMLLIFSSNNHNPILYNIIISYFLVSLIKIFYLIINSIIHFIMRLCLKNHSHSHNKNNNNNNNNNNNKDNNNKDNNNNNISLKRSLVFNNRIKNNMNRKYRLKYIN